MKNNPTKKIIFLSIIFIIVIISIILLMLVIINFNKNDSGIIGNINEDIEKHEIKTVEKKVIEKKPSTLTEKNDFNTFSIQAVTEESIVNKYFEDFKYNAIHHIEDSYNTLNQEYKEKKFGNIENYNKYLIDRREILESAIADKYQLNKYEEYEQYICLDQYNNYYIFNKMPNMSYSVILDTHTVDLPQFKEKYAKANDGEKVGLNIEKFIDAINQKDYEYAYSVLDEEFKANYMSNINEFENYVKNNFFEKNIVNHIAVEREGDNILYKVKLIDKNVNQDSKYVIFVMKLLEDTKFVMSFTTD